MRYNWIHISCCTQCCRISAFSCFFTWPINSVLWGARFPFTATVVRVVQSRSEYRTPGNQIMTVFKSPLSLSFWQYFYSAQDHQRTVSGTRIMYLHSTLNVQCFTVLDIETFKTVLCNIAIPTFNIFCRLYIKTLLTFRALCVESLYIRDWLYW